MAEDEDIAALVIDNGSGMCKGKIVLRNLDEVFGAVRRGSFKPWLKFWNFPRSNAVRLRLYSLCRQFDHKIDTWQSRVTC